MAVLSARMRSGVLLLVAGLVLASTGGAAAESAAEGPAAPPSFLTGPNEGDALDIALAHLRAKAADYGVTAADLDEVVVSDRYTSATTGVTHIYLRQGLDDLAVIGSETNVNIARDGSVINVGSALVRDLADVADRTPPALTAEEAVEAAAEHFGWELSEPVRAEDEPSGAEQEQTLSDGGVSSQPIPARLVYQRLDDGVRLAWDISVDETSGDHWWSVRVDAGSGTVLAADDWANDELASGGYRVYAYPLESPNQGDRTLELDPSSPVHSPFGWHDTDGVDGPEFTVTRGNNVHAYTDTDANNMPDPGSDPDGGPGLLFDHALDLTQHPSTYRDAAVTNLFYWNNVIHDVLAGYGFDEAAGNFQVTNYSGAGTGGDDVRAEAQDGSGTNNANFSTPPEGSRPRMQMFVWTTPFPNLLTVHSGGSAGQHPMTGASFGPAFPGSGLSGTVELANDGTITTTDACEPLVGFTPGAIALIDRGTCTFVVKVKNAQNAGASAVIIANNVAGNASALGGSDATITIPSGMISQALGTALKGELPLAVTIAAGPGSVPRDSDLDAGVIVHEYAHGISNRLTGGPATTSCLGNAEQMGEGWSDWYALAMTSRPTDTATHPRGVGAYLRYQPDGGPGIRPTPYTTDLAVNPTTYGAINGLAIPHGVGYAWASMLWEVYWNLVERHGYNPRIADHWSTGGNNLAFQLVTDGLKLQPCRPGFVDGRDAILLADQVLTGGENQCAIWRGFAKRGLGASALQGSNVSTTDGTQAFDLPSLCLPQIAVAPPAVAVTQDKGTTTQHALTVSNAAPGLDAAALDWTVTEAAADCSSPGDVPWLGVDTTAGSTPAGGASGVVAAIDATGLAVGTHGALLCVASNDAGTPMVAVPVGLTVHYPFAGFFAPLDNAPARNRATAGSAQPVKFSLGGNEGLDVFAAGHPASRPVSCTTLATAGPLVSGANPGGSSLSYDADTDTYHWVWKTEKSWGGTCRELVVGMRDGTSRSLYFQFR